MCFIIILVLLLLLPLLLIILVIVILTIDSNFNCYANFFIIIDKNCYP